MSYYNSNLCQKIRNTLSDYLNEQYTHTPLTRGERYVLVEIRDSLEECVTSWLDFRHNFSFCKNKSTMANQAYIEDITFLFWFYSQTRTLEECKEKFESLLSECFPYYDEARSDFCENCDIIMAHRAKKLGVEYKRRFAQAVPQTNEDK